MATSMGSRSKLSKARNGFIELQSSMPKWGQLGCNGFIVFNSGQQQVVSAKTSAFMQVRDLAFRHVESIVDALIAGLSAPAVCPGQFLRLTGLQKAVDLNGQDAICLSALDASGRCAVQILKSGRKLTVKPSNLEVLEDGQSEGSEDEYESDDDSQSSEGRDNSCEQGGDAGNEPVVAKLASISTVLIPEMDHEHETCATALSALEQSRTVESLQSVLAAYEDHFTHEEQLLDTWLYADAKKQNNAGFNADASARRTHFADHARMMRNLKDRIRSQQPGSTVGAQFVDQVLRDFEEHADRYDGNYAERMAVAMGIRQEVQPSPCVAGS